MTIDSKQFGDLLAAEGADIHSIAGGFANLVNAVDLLIAAQPGSPDFTDQFNAVVAQRAELAGIAAGISAEAAKIVPPAPPTPTPKPVVVSITGNGNLAVGASEPLTISVSDGSTPVSPSWSSSDDSVATVAQDGVVTGIAPGTAAIAVSCAQGMSSVSVTVDAPTDQ